MNIDLNIDVLKFMATNITVVHPKESISAAEKNFKRVNKKILPVVSNGDLRGILFDRDFESLNKTNSYIVKISGQNYSFGGMTVEDYMTTDFYVLSVNSKLSDVVKFFTEKRQYYIPIVDDKKLVGFITPFDIFAYLQDLQKTEL